MTGQPRVILAVNLDGTAQVATVPPGERMLDYFYRLIGCDTVDVVALAADLEMWVDDEGLLVDDAQVNHAATGIAAEFGRTAQNYCGPAVFTGGADEDGETLGLTELQVQVLTAAAATLHAKAVAEEERTGVKAVASTPRFTVTPVTHEEFLSRMGWA